MEKDPFEEDPFEELLYNPEHTYTTKLEGAGFRAICSCGWRGKGLHDNEYSASWQGLAHQWLQENPKETS